MKPAPLIVDIDPFDLEGYLFVNFPVDAWLNGQARKALETEIRANGDGRIDHATILTALGTMERRALAGLKPWEVEAVRIERCPESVKRFPPYWKPNGGPHDISEFGRVPSWDFGDDEPSAPSASSWDFGDEGASDWSF